MKNIIFIIGICSIPMISGCVTAEEAIISNHDNGFHQTQLNQYTYLLSYKGHAWNTPEEEKRILLSKAAKITQESGYRYFAILGAGGDETFQQYNNGYGQEYNLFKPTSSMTFQIVPHPKQTTYLLDSTILINNK